MDTPHRETLSIAAAAERLGISRRTLYLWMQTEKVEWIRTASGSRRLFADSLWRRQDGTLPAEDLTRVERAEV